MGGARPLSGELGASGRVPRRQGSGGTMGLAILASSRGVARVKGKGIQDAQEERVCSFLGGQQ